MAEIISGELRRLHELVTKLTQEYSRKRHPANYYIFITKQHKLLGKNVFIATNTVFDMLNCYHESEQNDLYGCYIRVLVSTLETVLTTLVRRQIIDELLQTL